MQKRLHKWYWQLASVFIGIPLLLTACTVEEWIKLHNNSDNYITVVFSNGTKQILRPNKAAFLGYSTSKVVMKHADKEWTFQFTNRPPSHYWGTQEGKKRTIQLQIEKEGEIYVVSREHSLPVGRHERQPSGYPLKPIPVGK